MAGTPSREPERIIGRYALFDQIGAGGMATVHFGRLLGPAGFSKTVAIKRLHPHFARDPEFSAMFLDEARLAARVQHPNVVATLDVVARDGELFLVMEFVEGLSLAGIFWEAVRSQRRIPVRVVGAIMVNVLSGLHAAHEATNEQGHPLALIHRDVSPQNVLVGRDGVARVLDFGIAKAVGRSHTTREGRIKGKLAYMPPEQIKAQPLDRRVDIYAASVVLWELLTMRRLFDEDDDATTIWRAVHEDPPKPSSFMSDLPEGTDELVMRGLAKDPTVRYATAREMAMAVERTLGVESMLHVSDFVTSCNKDTLEKMASKVRQIESISEELHTSDILPEEHTRPRQAASDPSEAATTLRDGGSPSVAPLPELPALEVPDIPLRAPASSAAPVAPIPVVVGSSGVDPLRRTQAYPFGPEGAPAAPSRAQPQTLLGGFADLVVPEAKGPGSPVAPFQPASGPAALPPSPPPSRPQASSGAPISSEPRAASTSSPSSAFGPAPAARPSQPRSSHEPIAMELAVAPRTTTGGRPNPYPLAAQRFAAAKPARPSATAGIPPVLVAVLGIALAAGGAYAFFGRNKAKSSDASQRNMPPPGGVERSCEAARKSIQNGGELGPLDTYGWVVEIWLAREDGEPLTETEPALVKLRGADGALDPAYGIRLGEGNHGEVVIDTQPSPPPNAGKEPGVVVRLASGYASAFFSSQTRPAFLKLADGAFDASKATIGAMYARCGHLPFHDIGAWFRGKDAQATADAIGFEMGGYAEAPWVQRSVFGAVGKDGSSLASYRRSRIGLDAAQFTDEVHLLGGSTDEEAGKGVTVVFPLTSPLRAMSMARWVTKQSNLE